MPLNPLKRTLEFATPGTSLYVRNEQLMIAREDEKTVSVPLEDIGVVVLDNARCTVTQSVLSKLSEYSVAVLVCNARHLPSGLLLPVGSHSQMVSVQRIQLQVSESKKRRLWQDVIQAKVRMQSHVLLRFNDSDGGVGAMAKRVLSGDSTNIEAHAAQKYWKALFGREFRRDRNRDGINELLNYGYAVLRASISRSIVAAGLLPSIGIHHHNRSNAFCLADDLMEPFRPYVDQRVKEISIELESNSEHLLSLQNRLVRSKLLSLLGESIHIDSGVSPMGLATSMTVSSLKRCFAERSENLVLPCEPFVAKEFETPLLPLAVKRGVRNMSERQQNEEVKTAG